MFGWGRRSRVERGSDGSGPGALEPVLATEATDEELIRRVQAGESEAFGEIYGRHSVRIRRFVRMLGAPEAECDDLVAETFCRALEHVDNFDPRRGKRYLPYLYAVARNLAADRHRRNRGHLPLDELGEHRQPAAERWEGAIVEEICRREQMAVIRRGLEQLAPGDREILLLAYERNLSSREIMEVMGKPSVTSVTTHVYRAMRRLREFVTRAESPAGVTP